MQAYGYRFDQTIIAGIEFGQHPLRVRELADFAALFGIEVHELIYPRSRPERSLAEIDQEIAEVQDGRKQARKRLAALAEDRRRAQAALTRVEAEHRACHGDALALERKLMFLRELGQEALLREVGDVPAQRRPRSGRRVAPLA
jgi:septal ring factor EnvC (AmiA/AmiB activator)